MVHATEPERTSELADVGAAGDLVIADTRDQVADLNAAIRDHRRRGENDRREVTTARGEPIGLGDRVVTRRNDAGLRVANRQTWTVTGVGADGSLILHGRGRYRQVPAQYATAFVELAYATTVHGAQGETVDSAHVVIGDTTGAAAAYVAMTRGQNGNTAHLVADTVEQARKQWVEVFARDRADLGPAHAKRQAIEAIDRYGPQERRRPVEVTVEDPWRPVPASGGGIGM